MTRVRRLSRLVLVLMLAVSALSVPVRGLATETELAKATFAGGCFWCMEEVFEAIDGVVSVVSGYTGGRKPNPSYPEVSSGWTGHAEAVEIRFDPARVSYEHLLEVFWRNVDPTTPDRQFCDLGNQYRTAIYYHNEEQRRLVEASLRRVQATKPFAEPIVTEIAAASTFYVAEDYHQDFYKINWIRYNFYKYNCGRTQRLEELWGPKAG